MAWAKVDDRFPLHPKTIQAGPFAAYLYVCGLCYCNAYLTDGFIPEAVVGNLGLTDAPLAAASSLVKVGLWDKVQGGFRVHDFADHNKSKDQVASFREAQRKRKEAWRQAQKTRKERPGHAPVTRPVTPSVPGSVPESVTTSVPPVVTADVLVVSHPIPSHPIKEEEVQEPSSQKTRRVGTKKSSTALTVAKTPNDQRFEIFWKIHWPKTRRVGKKNAKREWDKLGVDDAMFDQMVTALAVMTKSAGWLKEGGHYIPHPERWLKNRRFEDDLDAYRNQSTEDANAALLEGRYGDKDQKLMDDGKTIDADFWPVDDEGGDDD